MHHKVVVLLLTSSVARVPVYRHLHDDLGLTLVLVAPRPAAAEFAGCFDHWLPHGVCDVDGLCVALLPFLSARHLAADAICSFDEYGVYPAALVAEAMGLRSVPLPAEALRRTSLKSEFRAFCAASGVAAPKVCVLPRPADGSGRAEPRQRASPSSSSQDGEAAAAPLAGDTSLPGAVGATAAAASAAPALSAHIDACMRAAGVAFPIVMKPSPGAGSLLARRCDDLAEAAAHAREMWNTMEDAAELLRPFAVLRRAAAGAAAAPTHSRTDALLDVLVEEFIAGDEVDIDCIVEHGCVRYFAISDNFPTVPPYFAEVGGLCPSVLPVATAQRALRDLLFDYVAACGTELHGVLHFEAKYDPLRQRAFVIEVNGRLGSAETHTMVRCAYRGLDLGESLVRCALGEPIAPQLRATFPECFADGVPAAQEDARAGAAASELDRISPSSSLYVRPPDFFTHPLGSAAPPPPPPRDAEACDAGSAGALRPAGESGDPACGDMAAYAAQLGGPACGAYPPHRCAASVNLYPAREGTLRHAAVSLHAPLAESALAAFSVAAQPGARVGPPPRPFGLLCWMVAVGASAADAVRAIRSLSESFQQTVEADS